MSYKYNFTLLVKILFAINKSVATLECGLIPLYTSSNINHKLNLFIT